MEDSIARAKAYRIRARELRTTAEALRDPDANAKMLKIAEDYIRLAEAVEKPRI